MYVSHIRIMDMVHKDIWCQSWACRLWHGYDWVYTYIHTIRETAKNIGSISNGLFRRWKEREKTQGTQKNKRNKKAQQKEKKMQRPKQKKKR